MVLAGAQRLIEKHRPAIFVEIDAKSLTRSGSSPEELIQVLTGFGYRACALTKQGVGEAEETSELLARAASGYIDVLFVSD